MKKVIKLTESDLEQIVKRVLKEQSVVGAPNFGIPNYGNNNLPSGVKEVQKALIFNGFRIKDDGVFGPATKDAVRQFQKKKGIKQTGNVGPITAKALGVQPLTSATNQKLSTTATNKPKVNVNAKVAPSKEDSWWDKTKNFCSSPLKRLEEFKGYIDSKTVSLNPLPPHIRAFLSFLGGQTTPITSNFFKPEELQIIANKVNSYFPSNPNCKRNKKCNVSFYQDTDWSKIKKGEEKVVNPGLAKAIGLTIGNGEVIDNGNSYIVKDIYDFNNFKNNPSAYSLENVGSTVKNALSKITCGNYIQGIEELASYKQSRGYKGIPVEIEIPKTKTV
jgi:peptidoglycan hydrolase-like protein with peptidoglycan-binding domain